MSSHQVFVLGIMAIAACYALVKMSIRARHGFAPESRSTSWNPLCTNAGADDRLTPDRKTELLVAENEKLHGQISRLEERLAVLERIATDPAERVSREIDALR
ncbi:MAG: hypothetical protein V4460_11925 [Pseudomonadota bacterium]